MIGFFEARSKLNLGNFEIHLNGTFKQVNVFKIIFVCWLNYTLYGRKINVSYFVLNGIDASKLQLYI
jgi:hypothetical protein